jgi:hypothetical protein
MGSLEQTIRLLENRAWGIETVLTRSTRLTERGRELAEARLEELKECLEMLSSELANEFAKHDKETKEKQNEC